jgi:hypothetical protein
MCSRLKKKYFDSLALKPLGLYVNLVGHIVAYSQPFNLVLDNEIPPINKGAMEFSFWGHCIIRNIISFRVRPF